MLSAFTNFASVLKYQEINEVFPTMKKILFLFLTLLFISIESRAGVGGPTFYYKFVADPNETGAGKVYVTNKEVGEENVKYYDHYGTTVFTEGSLPNVKTVTVTAYLYAQPADGYIFTHWARLNDYGKETVFSQARHTSDLVTTTNTDKQDPKVNYFKAYFAKMGLVYPKSSDETLGTVMIDIPTNTVGDVVTMTAIPDLFNGQFKGWQRNNQTTLITDNPLTLTVSNANRGIYTAVYEPKGVEDKGVFVIMQNVGTKRYFGVTGDSEPTFGEEQRYFTNSMMLVDDSNTEVFNNPSFLMKVKGIPNGTGGLNNVSIESQGISTFDIGQQYFRMECFEENEYFIFATQNGFTGYLKDNGSAETGTNQMELLGSYHSPGIWNRWNYNRDYAWRFKLIDEEHFDTNYIGAKPEASTLKNGKYYTTMYTAFAYECRDGMKAYIADKFMDNGDVHLKQLKDGRVPAYTAVVLECNGTTPKQNRIMPLREELTPIEGNLLKGEIWLNDGSDNPDNYRTKFDPSTMRLLSKKGTFGKEPVTDPFNNNASLTYIANNTCYLDVSGLETPPDEISPNLTPDNINRIWGDANGDGTTDISDVVCIVNYILDRPLKSFVFVNADTSENKMIELNDALLIVAYILGKI